MGLFSSRFPGHCEPEPIASHRGVGPDRQPNLGMERGDAPPEDVPLPGVSQPLQQHPLPAAGQGARSRSARRIQVLTRIVVAINWLMAKKT